MDEVEADPSVVVIIDRAAGSEGRVARPQIRQRGAVATQSVRPGRRRSGQDRLRRTLAWARNCGCRERRKGTQFRRSRS